MCRTRPSTEEGPTQEEAWFNIFVLHQNRVAHGPGAKDCLTDKHLPTFLDFVVWGHEHECRIDPWVSLCRPTQAIGAV